MDAIHRVGQQLLNYGKAVQVGHWQALDVKDKPQGDTHELRNFLFRMDIPITQQDLIVEVEPNLPWAEDHFQERVSRIPHNPPPSAEYWPFAVAGHKDHVKDEKFSHTYPERFWPKQANATSKVGAANRVPPEGLNDPEWKYHNWGIRFKYGDLDDVVNLLAREPYTRQAYLPVFFPEDTGAYHGERIPCSLGYDFLLRDNLLHCNYYIRSVDFLRHARDDIYMAARLCQWVLEEIRNKGKPNSEFEAFWAAVQPGELTMFMKSLHVFKGDLPKMRREYG